MAYTLSDRASGEGDPTAKNRVWGFFDEPTKPRPKNRRQSLQPRRKNRPCSYKTASGIPYWPSRDPIGERGGVNLYGFVLNDPYNWVDLLGLAAGDRYKTQDEAALAALNDAWNLTQTNKIENCGWILKEEPDSEGKCYTYTEPENSLENSAWWKEAVEKAKELGWSNERISEKLATTKAGLCYSGEKPDNAVGDYHTHGIDGTNGGSYEEFSDGDHNSYIENGVDGYLATPSGGAAKYPKGKSPIPQLKDRYYNPKTGAFDIPKKAGEIQKPPKIFPFKNN